MEWSPSVPGLVLAADVGGGVHLYDIQRGSSSRQEEIQSQQVGLPDKLSRWPRRSDVNCCVTVGAFSLPCTEGGVHDAMLLVAADVWRGGVQQHDLQKDGSSSSSSSSEPQIRSCCGVRVG
jgi:hypothetical protein